eukprot:6046896-Heterocapsa_arctica.AAC.1
MVSAARFSLPAADMNWNGSYPKEARRATQRQSAQSITLLWAGKYISLPGFICRAVNEHDPPRQYTVLWKEFPPESEYRS